MKKFIPILSAIILFITLSSAHAQIRVWYLKQGGSGDGTSRAQPTGSAEYLEDISRPNDIVFIVPTDNPLNGGFRMKDGQALIGLEESGLKPVITNSDTIRNNGCGVVLANNNRIWNIIIENTQASGIYGENISGSRIENVNVYGANRSAVRTNYQVDVLGHLPHGGIIFINQNHQHSADNYIFAAKVQEANGIGIGSLSMAGTKGHLVIRQCQVENGGPVDRFNMGIGVCANGLSSHIYLDIDSLTVEGRTELNGRNIAFLSFDGARITSTINRSRLNGAGQDGLLAAAWHAPAQVEVEIRRSLIENAGQSNVEGTILNLPPGDTMRAKDAQIAITIEHSTIKEAGGFDIGLEDGEDPAGNDNIWVGSSALAQQMDPNSMAPFPQGSYELVVRNCIIRGGEDFGIGVGNIKPGMTPEQADFDITIMNNTIMDNSSGEVMIAAPKAVIDARRNYWGNSEGLSFDRIKILGNANINQIDASEPIPYVEGVGEQRETFKKESEYALAEVDTIRKEKITTIYSKGYQVRASAIHNIVENCVEFYEAKFPDVIFTVQLMVLDKDNWKKVDQFAPFGMPTSSLLGKKETLLIAADKKAVGELFGRQDPLPDDKLSAFDNIVLHELGHVFLYYINLVPKRKWEKEFLATYFAICYLEYIKNKTGLPRLDLADIQPRYHSLEDFEKPLKELGPMNYGWYQGKLTELAIQLHPLFKTDLINVFIENYSENGKHSDPLILLKKNAPKIMAQWLKEME